ESANTRLALFSGSDLELLRDTGARGARKTGLDLLVLDRRTDQVRVPETLSGGETFFVSLALALGLADIVMGEAGGVQMETLFIDEGFGSLDPETLETVVREIGRLAESGRVIGIVSHVGDMKAQIAEQIHVRRGADARPSLTVTACRTGAGRPWPPAQPSLRPVRAVGPATAGAPPLLPREQRHPPAGGQRRQQRTDPGADGVGQQVLDVRDPHPARVEP